MLVTPPSVESMLLVSISKLGGPSPVIDEIGKMDGLEELLLMVKFAGNTTSN